MILVLNEEERMALMNVLEQVTFDACLITDREETILYQILCYLVDNPPTAREGE